jgi:hypothetical protein
MDSVYIVCEKTVAQYIPEPMDVPSLNISNLSKTKPTLKPMLYPIPSPDSIPRFDNSFSSSSLLKPRFDTISPDSIPRFDNSFSSSSVLKPRFDPISPDFSSKFQESTKNNIVCLCKDLDTAKHYLAMSSNRYIMGPYKIL